MFQGKWRCGSCGGDITELPFEPKGEAGLMCKACFAKTRDTKPAGGGAPVHGEKKKFAGDWKCSGCSKAITELPFQPRDTSNLKCLDCFKASRA